MRDWLRHGGVVAALACALALAAACGSDSGDESSAIPTLAGTPIPAVVATPTATPVCDRAPAGNLPALPADVPIPPGAVAETVETSPHLRVVFRVVPPESTGGRPPYTILVGALVDQFRANGWGLKFNDRVDGQDWDFSKPDGRTGHFNVMSYAGCTTAARLLLDLNWITG